MYSCYLSGIPVNVTTGYIKQVTVLRGQVISAAISLHIRDTATYTPILQIVSYLTNTKLYSKGIDHYRHKSFI